MVKLPNLELKEVERIVEALDHYCSALSAAKSEDTARICTVGGDAETPRRG
jgi:hypothetical protein